jgi:hypothetical protein
MEKFKLFFSKNAIKIFKIQIFSFLFFILISQLYGLDSEAHRYFNRSIVYNFNGGFSLLMLGLFSVFFWVNICYPFIWFLQLILIIKLKIFDKTKLWLILISILLYFFSIASLIYLYSIQQHQGFLERASGVGN